MKSMIRSVVYITMSIVLLASLSACNGKLGAVKESVGKKGGIFKPSALFLRNLPQGDDPYSTGFRDGCETFMGIVGTGTLRLLPVKIDGYKLTGNKYYARGFSDGSTHCTFYFDWLTH